MIYINEKDIICVNCLNCGKAIDPLYSNEIDEDDDIDFTGAEKISVQNLDGTISIIYCDSLNSVCWTGNVMKMNAGYGSNEDGGIFLIGICDECLINKLSTGNIIKLGDYFNNMRIDSIDKEVSESVKLSRRIRNINTLTKDGKQ